MDLSKAKRVFLLGPSHHHYLSGCALSQCDEYETPLGNLAIDKPTLAELQGTGEFEKMSRSVDEAEHSLEMHCPYIFKMLKEYVKCMMQYPVVTDAMMLTPESHFKDPSQFPTLVPIMVGATSASTEQKFGKILAPYLADTTSVFVISSDFCHWGSRFRYTYYQPPVGQAVSLKSSTSVPNSRPIHESIALVDQASMDAVESGSHDSFVRQLEETGNTVCGRHPIGVVMAALETLRHEGKLQLDQGCFNFVKYDRSELCTSVRDSSVSYCSAFATL